jgi:multidrug efflux pump subunit AcrA (membrane-fusion protein)
MRPQGKLLICTVLLLLLLSGPESAETGADESFARGPEVAECTVRFPERVLLASERMGILDEVLSEGTPVSAGQIVARLRDHVLAAALAVADARATADVAVQVARKEQEQAQAEYDSGLRANQNRPTYPETEISRRRLAAEAASLRIQQAEEDLRILEKLRDEALAELETSYLRAPFDGTVNLQMKRVGEGVQHAEPVLELINTEVVHVEGFVPLHELRHWRVGRPVDVYADLSPAIELEISHSVSTRRNEAGPYNGVIGFIDQSIQPLSRTVRIWAEVPNADGRLRDGMTARMVLAE